MSFLDVSIGPLAVADARQEVLVVRRQVGRTLYQVPLNYINPYGDTTDHGGTKATSLSVVMFLPEFGGFNRKNFLDKFRPDRVDVTWTAEEAPNGVEAEVALDRLTRLGGLEKAPSTRDFGLEGRKNRNGDITWAGEGTHGHLMLIDCGGADDPNPLCVVRYHHKKNGYWLFYHYSARHLPTWRQIDDGVNDLLSNWAVKT